MIPFQFVINFRELPKRFFKSDKHLSNCHSFGKLSVNRLSEKLLKRRYLSSEASPNPPSTKSKIKISRITSKSSAGNAIDVKEEIKEPPVKPIGIVDIHQWEDLKNVRKWICVFSFPYIAHLRTFQRLKLYLTVFNIGLLPLNLILYSNQVIGIEPVVLYTALSVFSTLALYIIGNLFRCFVGRVYISEDLKYVRFSHLTFFGNRLDDDIEKDDIVPLMDSNDRLNDWYCAIEQYSNNSMLYMSLKFGGIIDRDLFEKIFGQDSAKFFNNYQ